MPDQNKFNTQNRVAQQLVRFSSRFYGIAPWKPVGFFALVSVGMAVFGITVGFSISAFYLAMIPIALSALLHERRVIYLSNCIILVVVSSILTFMLSDNILESITTISVSALIVGVLCELIFSLSSLRESAETAQRESAAMLDATLNAIPDVIGVQGVDHEIIRYNKAGYEFLGMTQEEVVGKKCYELIGRGMPCNVCATETVYRTKEAAKIVRYEPMLGSWLDVRTYPILDKDGNLVRLIEHLRDISDIKQAEDALKESKQFLQDVFDAIQDGICVLDRDLNVVQVNRWMEDLFRAQMPLVGKKCYHVFRCRETPCTRCPSRRTFYSGDVDSEVLALSTNEAGWFEVSSFPLKDSTGETMGIIEYIKDISQRVKAEEENNDLQERLLQSQKMEAVGRLAGGIAHDFNNMLTAIKGNSELLSELVVDMERSKIDLPAEFATYLAEVGDAADRAQSLTTKLLTFSRKQVVQPEIISLVDLLENLGPMLRRVISESIELVTPNPTTRGYIYADAAQVEQIVLNLVVNARDAMHEGGTITFSVEEILESDVSNKERCGTSGCILLTVADTGSGIPDDVRSHIFEPFFTTKEVGKGTGLGLATVYGIVEQLGGSISVSSAVGKGSTFTVCLPASEAPLEKTAGIAEPVDEVGPGTETILLVEDEELVRDIIIRSLERVGYNILPTASSTQALQLFRDNRDSIDLLISDVVMPGIGGVDLAAQIMLEHPSLKVLFISGYTHDTLKKIDASGKVNFIQKPFSPDDLASKVRSVLDQQE